MKAVYELVFILSLSWREGYLEDICSDFIRLSYIAEVNLFNLLLNAIDIWSERPNASSFYWCSNIFIYLHKCMYLCVLAELVNLFSYWTWIINGWNYFSFFFLTMDEGRLLASCFLLSSLIFFYNIANTLKKYS